MKSNIVFPAGFGTMLLLTSTGLNQSLEAQAKKKLNVLFIAVDDLKPITAAYGDKIIKTPGIDRIAREGAVGKIYHNGPGATGPGHDAPSWSIPWRNSNPPNYANSKESPATECADVPDDFYYDYGKTASYQTMTSTLK